jgi:D-sedoheptulose 7-phosphate isomerase
MMTMPETANAHVTLSNEVCDQFFRAQVDEVARACHAMAKRFKRGGRLFAYGEAAQRSDVAHIVVEFVHPVIVGKRALPAIALTESGAARDLELLGNENDVVIVLSAGPLTDAASALITLATLRGMLVLALTGESPSRHGAHVGHEFAVPSQDTAVVQETHELLYHVLWELVHVFIEHAEVPE